MRRATFSLVALVLALAGLTAASGALAGGGIETKVTIKADGGDFSGTVKSDRPARCAKDRKINLMRVRSGKDEKIAMDTASKNGNRYEWSTGNTGAEKGRYYAKTGKAAGCANDKSDIVKVERPG